MRVTLKDIAKAAGVSSATASLVLNSKTPKGRVREEVAETVRSIAQEMGYRRDASARAMKTGRSECIAMVLDAHGAEERQRTELNGGYWADIMGGVELAARKKGWHVLVIGGDNKKLGIERGLEAAYDNRCDGIIVAGAQAIEVLNSKHGEPQCPIIAISNQQTKPTHPNICNLTSDISTAYTDLMGQLHDQGTNKIAYLGTVFQTPDTQMRTKHLAACAKKNSIQIEHIERTPPQKRAQVSNQTIQERVIQGAYDDMMHYLNKHGTPKWSYVIAYNDLMAIGALSAIRDKDLAVPHDISVIGCDNSSAYCTHPALSSIDPRHTESGIIAAELLIDSIINQKPLPNLSRIKGTYIKRNSSLI